MDRAELSRLIKKAFRDTPPPSSGHLAHSYGAGRARVEEDFAGKRWDELTATVLCPPDQPNRHEVSIWYLTPDAFRYFLPAFMLAIVNDFVRVDMLTDSLVTSLMDPGRSEDPEAGPYYKARVGELDIEERRAVVHFLDWLLREHGADLQREDDIQSGIDRLHREVSL